MRERFHSSLTLGKSLILAAAVAIMPLLTDTPASAAVQSSSPQAKISFTFDDGDQSAYTQAAPALAKYGLNGTSYVISSCVGMTSVPNSCRANTDTPYMTWAQVKALQTTYGWEIGSHTVDHKCLASSAKQDPYDCQATVLTQAQVVTELSQSKNVLAANGITATDFAPPYGDYNNMVLAQIAKYYATMRQFKNAANTPNVWPYSEYYLQDHTIQEKTDTVASLEALVNNAITNKQWLILTFHDIKTTPSTNPDDYEFGTNELTQLAAYVKNKQNSGLIQSVHIKQGPVTSTTNLLANSTFDNGISGGWTTPNPTYVTKDSANNGSYPSATNSIKMVGTTQAVRLYSPKISVNASTTYMLKNFLNTANHAAGGVEFYIDEYDINGNWVSGQYKGAENSAFVENLNYTYKPSSANVVKADLQITVTANAQLTAYLDNSQWFPLNTQAVSATNLIANGTFDNGISGGWTTDDATNITADSAGNGSPSNPINSVSMHSGAATTTGHLFSPHVAVDPSKKYTITSWVNLKAISNNSLGFYIDEYDINGNWVSGQYKYSVTSPGAGDVSFGYQPTSTNVKTASLQIIVPGNAGISAYYDDVRWYAN